jgi:hypothetical protein
MDDDRVSRSTVTLFVMSGGHLLKYGHPRAIHT